MAQLKFVFATETANQPKTIQVSGYGGVIKHATGTGFNITATFPDGTVFLNDTYGNADDNLGYVYIPGGVTLTTTNNGSGYFVFEDLAP